MVLRTRLGGSSLPCRGQEAPQRALHQCRARRTPCQSMWLRRRATNGRARPVAELDLVTRALEVGHAIAEIDLRVGDRPIVDRGTDLLEDELEKQPGLQITDVLVELFGEVALQ